MARPKRWTAAGRVVGEAEQMELLPDPVRALEAAGWSVDMSGDDHGHVWGHATRNGVDDWMVANDTSVAAVYDRLWRAAQAADAQGTAQGEPND